MERDLQDELFSQMEGPFTGETLFDHITDLVYFIKNSEGQYVVVNQSLAERCGYRKKQDLVGRTADQIYPSPLGESYRAQDEALLQTGKPILNQLELQLYPSGGRGWCLTHKVPIRDKAHCIIGLVGISKDLHAPIEKSEDYTPIAQTIQFIQNNYGKSFTIVNLAAMAQLSLYQFEQRIQKIFEISPKQFVQKVRMDAAVRRLNETDDPIARIALDCGYADQSTFSRQFKQTVGISPAHYRKMSRL
jgi:PAS domain S-box-containing protein